MVPAAALEHLRRPRGGGRDRDAGHGVVAPRARLGGASQVELRPGVHPRAVVEARVVAEVGIVATAANGVPTGVTCCTFHRSTVVPTGPDSSSHCRVPGGPLNFRSGRSKLPWMHGDGQCWSLGLPTTIGLPLASL